MRQIHLITVPSEPTNRCSPPAPRTSTHHRSHHHQTSPQREHRSIHSAAPHIPHPMPWRPNRNQQDHRRANNFERDQPDRPCLPPLLTEPQQYVGPQCAKATQRDPIHATQIGLLLPDRICRPHRSRKRSHRGENQKKRYEERHSTTQPKKRNANQREEEIEHLLHRKGPQHVPVPGKISVHSLQPVQMKS